MNKSTKQINYRYSVMLLIAMFMSAGWATAKAEELDKSAGDISRGAISWAQNCSRCHEMRDPAEFSDAMWRPIVAHMRVRSGLTGQQQRDILAFLQSANNPKSIKVSSTIKVAENTSKPTLSGKAVYEKTCIACHGTDGKGVLLGVPDLTKPDGRLSKPDEMLLQNITNGFQSSGSLMAMPAKGGNANLTDGDIKAVLAYLRESFGQ